MDILSEKKNKPKAGPLFPRVTMPERFCNFERLLEAMERFSVDTLVVSSRYNVFYLTGFSPLPLQSDEMPPSAVILTREDPSHPVMIINDIFVSYFLRQPTWVEDLRPFPGHLALVDKPFEPAYIDLFIPEDSRDTPYLRRAREKYADTRASAFRGALADLKVKGGRVAIDDMRLEPFLEHTGAKITSAHRLMTYAREIKTPHELRLLRQASALNQQAITRCIGAWHPDMTWKELTLTYHKEVADLGGFVRDPGAIVWSDPRQGMATGIEDYVLSPGTNVFFDCHGTYSLYCWDGGKSWIVADEPVGKQATIAKAAEEAMLTILPSMRPGARVAELQALGHKVFAKMGLSTDGLFVFFHGMGLSHADIEGAYETSNWELREGSVVAAHVLYTGDERHRYWLEDCAVITQDGGDPFFTWGFGPLTNAT